MFDRIIFLSEGYVIYNGRPEDCNEYFMQFGMKKLIHTNLADKLSIVASKPKHLLAQDTTIKSLSLASAENQSHNMTLSQQQREDILEILSRRFTLIDD